MYKKILSAVLSFALLGAVADADPVNAKTSVVVTVDCEGTPVQYVTNGIGSVGFPVIGSNSTLILVAYTTTVTDSAGRVVFYENEKVGQGNRTGQQGDLVTCTRTRTFENPSLGTGILTLNGTITVFRTPRGK